MNNKLNINIIFVNYEFMIIKQIVNLIAKFIKISSRNYWIFIKNTYPN